MKKRTAEEILKENNILLEKLQQEKPLLVHNITKSMRQFAAQEVEEATKQLEMSVNQFNHIIEICDKLNTGNVSHDKFTNSKTFILP